jgi:acyl carrier protein
MSSMQPGILKVIHAVSALSGDPAPDQSLFDSGALDSFTLPDLVTGLEKEFDVVIPDSDLVPERFDTIAKIETYLSTRKS